MANDLSAIRLELDALIRVIVKTAPVERIYLFGSFAYGTPHKDSDLDIYVVFRDDLPMRELEALLAIRLAIDPVQTMPLDVLGLKRAMFLDRSTAVATLEKTVAQRGIKIYG